MNRRELMWAVAGLPVLAGCGGVAPRTSSLVLTLSGQLLMVRPICAEPYDGMDRVITELRRGDVVFSDLEAAIRTDASGAPTRDTEFLHVAPEAVLGCIREMGFSLLALGNNHAWDLGTAGVMATREATLRAGFAVAGTGANLEEAAAPTYVDHDGMRVALVAMATMKIREGAAATESRAGVNELRLVDGAPHIDDAARILASITAARASADIVVAYNHNHDWGTDMSVVRPWARQFARACVDAGATVYASHGAPLLLDIERYRDAAIFHGLGSLVFHSRTEVGHYPAVVWESAIAHCHWLDGALESVEIVPVILNERGDDAVRHLETRGRPRIAVGEDAERILNGIAARSRGLGNTVVIRNERLLMQLR